jgi:SAM-dependent methyltransferase
LLTRIAEPLAQRARRQRLLAYRAALDPEGDVKVVDIGCGSGGLAALDPQADVVGVDVDEQAGYPGRRFVRADARSLPFSAAEFEIAYSNSLIEHLPQGDRPAFAKEVRRVAGRYWIQTPNRWFPVEPHVLLPGFQFLPHGAQRRLWRLGVHRGPYTPTDLLDEAELRGLFPEAIILRERFGGLTKSLIAVGPADRLRAK